MRPPGKPLGQPRRSLKGEDSLVTLFDNLRHTHYNTFIYSAEVVILNKPKNHNLGRNSEFGFMYKTLTIRANVISEMAFVPEFMEALKAYQGSLTDQSVYEVLKETYRQMLADGKNYRTARDVMNKVSMDVTGDSFSWHSDIVDTHTKYGFLFKRSLLPKADLNNLLFIKDFVSELDVFLEKGIGIEDMDIYKITKKLYFPKLKIEERSGDAKQLNKAIRHFSKALFGDEKSWEDEYSEYIQR